MSTIHEQPVAGVTDRAQTTRQPKGLRRLLGAVKPIVVLTMLTTVLGQILGAARGVLLARVLGPTGRGEFGTVMSFVQMFNLVGLLGTHLAVARRGARAEGPLDPLVRAAVRLGFCSGVCSVAIAGLLYITALPTGKRYLLPLCLLATLLLPLQHMRITLLAVDRGSGSFMRYNLNQLLFAATMPTLLFTVWYFNIAHLALVVSFMVFAPAMAFVALLASRPEKAFRGDHSPRVTTLVKEGVPFAVAQITSNLFVSMDTFAVLFFADLKTQGLYLAAIPIATLMVHVPISLGLFTFRKGARADGQVAVRSVLQIAGGVIVLQAASCFVLLSIMEWLILFFYKRDFAPSVPFAAILIPAHAIRGATAVAEQFLRARKKSIIGVWTRLVAFVGVAICLWMLYPQFKTMALPWAVLTGHAINGVLIFVALIWNCRHPGSAATESIEQPADA